MAAIGEEGECGHDIVDGVVGIGAFEMEGFEEFFEFVDVQAGFDQTGQFESVEPLAVTQPRAEGASYIVVENVVVEFDVVADKYVAMAVVEETGETFAAAEAFAVEVDR